MGEGVGAEERRVWTLPFIPDPDVYPGFLVTLMHGASVKIAEWRRLVACFSQLTSIELEGQSQATLMLEALAIGQAQPLL